MSDNRSPTGCETLFYVALALLQSVKGNRKETEEEQEFILSCVSKLFSAMKKVFDNAFYCKGYRSHVSNFYTVPAELCITVLITHNPYLAIYSSWLFPSGEL